MHRPLIEAVGAYVPSKVETSLEFEKRLPCGQAPGWLEETTGVQSRHVAEPGTDGSDLAVEAVRTLFERTELTPSDVDCLIYGAAFSDVIEPATAHILQNKLGWPSVPCFDAGNACNGVFDGLRIAEAFVKSGMYECVVVAAGESLTKAIPWPLIESGDDPMKHIAAYTLGDAAGAMLVRRLRDDEDPSRGIVASHTVARSDLWPHCLARGRGSTDLGDLGRDYLICDMKPMAAGLYELGPGVAAATLEMAGWDASDVDVLIPHQVSPSINAWVASLFGLEPEDAVSTIVEYGNCAAANLPLALDKAYRQGKLEAGTNVFLGAGAAGISLGAIATVW